MAVAAIVAFTPSAARKHLARDNETRIKRPEVELCEPICIFEDVINSWCLEFTDPHLQVGWEYEQDFSETEAE